jgi:hypothetical protein
MPGVRQEGSGESMLVMNPLLRPELVVEKE